MSLNKVFFPSSDIYICAYLTYIAWVENIFTWLKIEYKITIPYIPWLNSALFPIVISWY